MANTDQVVEMCRLAVDDIIRSVGGVVNLLGDDGKMELIRAISNRLTQLGADVDAVLGTQLANAYHEGMVDADALLHQVGQDVSIMGMNKQLHLAGIESIVADTMQDMNASFRTAIALGIADIESIMTEVNADIAKGMILGNGSNAVARRVEQSFLKSGMTSFITKDGKKLPLDFYAQTVTRTKMRVAQTTGAVNRYDDAGVNHVKIDEHHPTCQKCARYQGMVIALKAEGAQGFPVANEDVPLPPFHPNCQHTVRPFVMEGHSKTDIANEKKKWNNFDPDQDTRTDAQRNLYKNEQDIRKKARQEMKDYEIMKSRLGDKAPKTLSAYRRMKRKNDDSWKALQASYKQNLDDVDAGGSAPGTPKKKKGSSVGSSGVPVVKKKATKKATKPKPKPEPVIEPVVEPEPVIEELKVTGWMKRSNITTDKNDDRAHRQFDRMIDGVEYKDRRKVAKKLLDYVPGGDAIKIKIAKISNNGHVQSYTRGGMLDISEFALRSVEYRPEQYHYKTLFHEFFHANFNKLDYPPGGFDKEWTKWEETATEASAFYMTDKAGFDVSTILPSYSDHLIRTLPILKQLDEFKDAEHMVDFGAKFMKYRFDGSMKTVDWNPLKKRISDKGIDQNFNLDKYFVTHYKQYVFDDIDRYTDMIYDSLQQQKDHAKVTYKETIKMGLLTGISQGRITQEIRMIMPVLMNERGVKIP